MTEPILHPNLAPLSGLLGTWEGPGHGEYPTIAPFDYFESVTFSHVGKPMLAYTQRTRAADDGRPLHSEMGFLRAPNPGEYELVIAQPTGHTELSIGVLDGNVLRFDSLHMLATPAAKRVDRVTREFTIGATELSYRLAMAAVGQPLIHHLAAKLARR